MALVLLLAACGGSDPADAPSRKAAPAEAAPAAAAEAAAAPAKAAPAAGASAAKTTNSEFVALVERARASNHIVRAPFGFHSDEAIRGLEAAFEERFGFELKLENEPGHPVRDMPTKITVAGKGGNGVIDSMLWGNAAVTFPVLEQGLMRKPNWDVVAQEWPQLLELKTKTPAWITSSGENMQDYCALAFHSFWIWNYNPRNVRAEEVANLTTADLLTPQWANRVVADERALGYYYYPLAPGWDEARTKAYMHNLGANGLKLFAGGSRGVHQAILTGEGDIGMANAAIEHRNNGRPIDFAIAEFTTGANPNVSCLPKFGINDPDMAELYWAWDITEGRPSICEAPIAFASAGFLVEEASCPLMQDLWGKGLRYDQVVFADEQAEAAKVGDHRALAIDAQLAGIQSGTPVPYNY